MEFTKLESNASDYIILDNISEFRNNKDYLRLLCDRNIGIGAHGIIFISNSYDADIKLTIFNSDGSLCNFSGNALMCALRYLNVIGNIKVEVNDNIYDVKVGKDIIISIGKPIIDKRKIPVITENNIYLNEQISIDNIKYTMSCLYTTNPYAIVFVDDIDYINIDYLSAKIQYMTIFKEKINIVYLEPYKGNIKIRIWNKDDREIKSCSTAAAASVVALSYNKVLGGTKFNVVQKGGSNEIIYDRNEELYIKGNANKVYKGKILVKTNKH